MTDYIRKQDAIDMLQKHAERLTHQTNISLSNVRSGVMTAKWLIEDMPTADVRENVRGEWINTTSGEHYKCSQCGTLAPIWIDESNSCEYDKDISEWLSDFCPNCGADMRPISALSKNAEIVSNLKRGES